MNKSTKKIFLLHNIISPYRLPIFEEINKYYSLDVYFCKAITKERNWNTSLKGYAFKYTVLSSFMVWQIVLNYTLVFYLLTHKYDIYIITDNIENAFSILLTSFFARLFRKPIIVWSAQIEINKYLEAQLKEKLKYRIVYNVYTFLSNSYRRFLYLTTNRFIASCNRANTFLLSRGVSGKDIFIGTEIMPESLLLKADTKKEDTVYKDKKIILSIGYLRKLKGLDYLIKAFNKAKLKDTILIIGGIGEDETRLKVLARVNNNIHFIDSVNGIVKANYYSQADLFVLPTLFDAWGLVINEALYYGLPVLTTEEAAGSELIKNGYNGFVIPAADTNKLCLRLKIIMNNEKLLQNLKNHVKLFPKVTISEIEYGARPFIKAIESFF